MCLWEDNGQDDSNADEVVGSSNGRLSLTQARRNFQAFGASSLGRLRQRQRQARREALVNIGVPFLTLGLFLVCSCGPLLLARACGVWFGLFGAVVGLVFWMYLMQPSGGFWFGIISLAGTFALLGALLGWFAAATKPQRPPNKPHAANPAATLVVYSWHQWRGVADAER